VKGRSVLGEGRVPGSDSLVTTIGQRLDPFPFFLDEMSAGNLNSDKWCTVFSRDRRYGEKSLVLPGTVVFPQSNLRDEGVSQDG